MNCNGLKKLKTKNVNDKEKRSNQKKSKLVMIQNCESNILFEFTLTGNQTTSNIAFLFETIQKHLINFEENLLFYFPSSAIDCHD